MENNSSKAWALLVPTSMGIRLTPLEAQPVGVGDTYKMYGTSAETNVASVSSFLGLPVKVLTGFVKESPVADFIRQNLHSRKMAFEGPEVAQDGPWGFRHQINFADTGFGSRGPRVYNDRAGEVGRSLGVNDFDLERIFSREGVEVVHLSGLFAALSESTGELCVKIAETAQKYGTRVSFDLNYRASFWKNREAELSEVFHQIAGRADILIGNEEDFQLCLGVQGPEPGGSGIARKIDGFKEMINRVRKKYPGASVFATTLREVESAGRHHWGAIMYTAGEWHVIEPKPIQVLDRIGGGDGFVGGLLYGYLKKWDPAKWIRFGWATGALAVTLLTDYAQPADEAQVWSIWEGNARVQR